MKTNTIHLKIAKNLLFLAVFLSVPLLLNATNPPITNTLKNLSQGLLAAESEDWNPEMVIEGNTIHALWTNRAGNNEGYLFYCRSTDLGETWEPAKNIFRFKDGNRASDVRAQRLAVSGSFVYIGFAEYDYSNSGTGYIYFAKSSDGGATFSEVTELANSGGGYSALSGCFIRASGSKVAIVYRDANYNDNFEGLYCLFSDNNGSTFNKTVISNVNTTTIADFQMTENQMVVVHDYSYYYYGLNTGRVYVSVSNNNGTSFVTNKVSVVYTNTYGDQEKCLCPHDSRYVPKVAVEGNNIHLIFLGNNPEEKWTVYYARSTDGGQTFKEAVDINKGRISNIQNGYESVAASNGNVYMEYLSTGSKVYLVRSEDSGATLSEPGDLLPTDTHYIKTTWWPQLVIDPNDETGKTVYFGSGAKMTRKSVDGGKNFSGTFFLAPFLTSGDVRGSAMKIDNSGNVHWLSKARWGNNDYDIFYGHKKHQPEPGLVNKAYFAETKRYEKYELSIVPSSPSIEFDSVMTGEAWIKMLPGSGLGQNIFAKVNGYDGPVYQSPGYQMAFDDNYGKRRFSCGLQTDKGEFINWTGTDLKDTLWHHVAFTYDAGAGLNNFKSYLDGLLIAKQTVTGAIIPGDGMLFIGSRSNNLHENSKYFVDDIRLWSRALTQEELLENQTKTFTGNEDSLKLWLNFDDTFKDMSGNGNDAIPLYLGELKESDLDPPITKFEMYQVVNEISFNNKTTNATSFLWNFGNDKTSEQGNPKITYSTPGEYEIRLTSVNNTTVTSATGHATIFGLHRIEPKSAGNKGYATINIFGGSLSDKNSQILLRKEGEEEIIGKNLFSKYPGELSATFDLFNKKTGKWDVVYKLNTTESILKNDFTIEEGADPDIWVNLSGRSVMLSNVWQTYTVKYGNNGNIDAYVVPLWIALTNNPELEVEFIDLEITLPARAAELGIQDEIREMGLYVETDSVHGKPLNARVYPFLIPVIPANSSKEIHIRIKSPENTAIKVWMDKPWLEYEEDDSELKSVETLTGTWAQAACIIETIGFGVIDIATATIPGLGCLWAAGRNTYSTYMNPPRNKTDVAWTAFSYAVVLFDCGVNLSLIPPPLKALYVFLANSALYAKQMHDCMQLTSYVTSLEMFVLIVTSFDPNEIVGPAGYDTQNWIQKYTPLPYTVYFENKSEATAPAHEVYITDTLDLSSFDITDFGFGSFGWGDSIFSPPGSKMKEFSMDIDLRPGMELITRVSGKLDTLTGIVKWEFLSLNPGTLDLEEDPFLGFLPPNVTSPEGEGFVSFSVGLKEELGTGDEIRNKASIVFDANQPIITNEYLNTLDLDAPQSQVYPLEATIDSRFPVDWTGSDEGSGIKGYTVYVMINDTALVPWMINTPETTAIFEGEVGSSYKFYSIATDNVNLVEAAPDGYDAQTTVTVNVEEFDRVKTGLTVWPNPATDHLQVTLQNAPCGMYAVELVSATGSVKHSQLYEDSELQTGIKINIAGYPSGNYILRLVFGNKTESKTVVVQ